jgi:hypothetical protein
VAGRDHRWRAETGARPSRILDGNELLSHR